MERFNKFVGSVELDESYFGADRQREFRGKQKRGRGTKKQPPSLESFYVRKKPIQRLFPMPGKRPYRPLSAKRSIFAVSFAPMGGEAMTAWWM